MKKNNSRKYAKGLFDVAREMADADKVSNFFEMLKPLCDKETISFFSNPFVSEIAKIDIIRSTFLGLPETVFNFLCLLVKKNEIRYLSETIEKYNEFILDSKNIVKANVISAEKLDCSMLEKIKNIVEKITKKNVLLSAEIDASVIGGLLIKTGNLIIDNTIKRKLEVLRANLVK